MNIDYEPSEQTVRVEDAPDWMERAIQVSVTAHLNDRHANTSCIYLTADEASALMTALRDYLESR